MEINNDNELTRIKRFICRPRRFSNLLRTLESICIPADIFAIFFAVNAIYKPTNKRIEDGIKNPKIYPDPFINLLCGDKKK